MREIVRKFYFHFKHIDICLYVLQEATCDQVVTHFLHRLRQCTVCETREDLQ